jgi:hypothetical protein
MSGRAEPSPLGSPGAAGAGASIDPGTLARTGMPPPVGSDRTLFESAVQALQAQAANLGAHLELDAAARRTYNAQVQAAADQLRRDALAGRISWREAAQQAQETRNALMELVRQRSTPVGRARAQQLKSEGRTLNELVARKTQQLFGPRADFNTLTTAQRNQVYAEVVSAAGRSNPRVDQAMRRLGRAGRGLLFASLALSVYEVAVAEDKLSAAGREVAVTGAGIAGGIAGGALAGLACGPGAPVCVTVGAFVGGALAAFGVDALW